MNPFQPLYFAVVRRDGSVTQYAGIRAIRRQNGPPLVADMLKRALEEQAALEISWSDVVEWPGVRT